MKGLYKGTFVKTGMLKRKDLDLVASCVGASLRILSRPFPPPPLLLSVIRVYVYKDVERDR